MSGGATATVPAAGLPLANPAGLTSLELAVGKMLGSEARPPLPVVERGVTPGAMLEEILEPALAGGRCLVAFSGGRESAWLLAAATRAARRCGHADPLPVTIRPRGRPPSSEAAHQERIVTYLGLAEWERLDVGDELELLGSYARRALRDAGLLFPSHLFAFLPLLDLAREGWLLAGGVITDFYLYWRWARLSEVLAGRRRPGRRDFRDLASAALLGRARMARGGRRKRVDLPWLREDAAKEFDRLLLALRADVPVAFDAAMSRQRLQRCHAGTRRSLEALAECAGARFLMPFREDRFIAALAAAGGRRGFGDRASAITTVASDLLPVELLRRSEGAPDRHVHAGEASRSFVQRWSGTGLDENVVDVDALRVAWRDGTIPAASTMLLQLAFAHDELVRA